MDRTEDKLRNALALFPGIKSIELPQEVSVLPVTSEYIELSGGTSSVVPPFRDQNDARRPASRCQLWGDTEGGRVEWANRLDRSADLGTRRVEGDMRLNVFHYPIQDWCDAVTMNTLMGLAATAPSGTENDYKISYYAPQPRAVVEVVDFDDSNSVVGYGETGRAKLTTLTKEFFVPGFLERDEGEREPPYEKYPWDGVSGVRPFHELAEATTVGVY